MERTLQTIVRDVFGDDDARRLLLTLHDAGHDIPMATLRDELGLDGEDLAAAMDRLERHALCALRVIGTPVAGRRPVAVTASALGRFWAARWRAWCEETETAARETGLVNVE